MGTPVARPGNVRLLSDAAHGRTGLPAAEHTLAEPPVGRPGDRGQDGRSGVTPGVVPGHELLRLRRRVEELTSQQDELRSEVRRLMALMEERTLSQSRDSA